MKSGGMSAGRVPEELHDIVIVNDKERGTCRYTSVLYITLRHEAITKCSNCVNNMEKCECFQGVSD